MADRKQPGSSRSWRLSSGDSGCAGKAWDIASCRVWQVPSGATAFLLPFLSFASLCSISLHLLVEQSSLFSPSPSFSSSFHPPVAQSYPASRLKSTSLCVPVATFHPYSSLLPHPPSNKAPSHNTDTPTSWSSKWVNSSGTNTHATLRSRPLSVRWQPVSSINCDRP